MRQVDARIEHGHGGARAVVPGRPRLGGVHVRHRDVEQRVDTTVEIHAGRSAGEHGRGAGRVRTDVSERQNFRASFLFAANAAAPSSVSVRVFCAWARLDERARSPAASPLP